MSAIILTDLVKQFGQTTALAGVTLTVPAGSIFGFGPNGAGKTTTLRILTGLASRRPAPHRCSTFTCPIRRPGCGA